MAAKKVNTKAVETKKAVVEKKVETKKVVNEVKENKFITIEEATKLYEELGIKCKNPTAKGNYRIMGSKSSLNIKPQKGYYIYTTDEDYANVSTAGYKADDLVFEEGTNSQDHTRPNTIICTNTETLKGVLKLFTANVLNHITQEVVAEAK